jgi:hypothetical protein
MPLCRDGRLARPAKRSEASGTAFIAAIRRLRNFLMHSLRCLF